MSQWTDLFEQRGIQSRLAREFQVSRQAVNAWKKNAHVPAEHATKFELLTGVPREVVCDDFQWTKRAKRRTRSEAKEGV